MDRPSHKASVIGATIAPITTSLRSRGEMRSQKSRALSRMVDIATSHALRVNGEMELLHAVLAGLEVALRDLFVEAIDLLELADEQIDLLGRLRLTAELDLLRVDIELVDIERDLVLRWNLRVDLEQEVVRAHLGHRRSVA